MPASQGVSGHFSPRDIVPVWALDLNKRCKAQLGSYLGSHEDIVVVNTHHPWAFPEIYLEPTGNIQVTLKVFYIKTGVVKKPRKMTEFHIPDQVITLLDKWSKRSSREYMQSRLVFLNLHKHKFDWVNDDLDKSEGLVENSHPEIPAQMPGIDLKVDQDISWSDQNIRA